MREVLTCRKPVVRSFRGSERLEVAIRKLNPVLNGWCTYFRVGNTNRVFHKRGLSCTERGAVTAPAEVLHRLARCQEKMELRAPSRPIRTVPDGREGEPSGRIAAQAAGREMIGEPDAEKPKSGSMRGAGNARQRNAPVPTLPQALGWGFEDIELTFGQFDPSI